MERMGKFHRILEPGLAILLPFIDKIQYVKSLKEVAIEIPSQSAITADNVTLELDVSSCQTLRYPKTNWIQLLRVSYTFEFSTHTKLAMG